MSQIWYIDIVIDRNMFRVFHSCYVIGLAKLTQTPWLLREVYQMHPSVPLEDNLTLSSSLPVTCQMLCMADNFLMTLAMFYVVTMAVYLFCRPANPEYSEKVSFFTTGCPKECSHVSIVFSLMWTLLGHHVSIF